MKIESTHLVRSGERGMLTVVFIALLAIMMILVMAESRAIIHLRRETKFLEQRQIKRLTTASTNAVVRATSPEKSESK